MLGLVPLQQFVKNGGNLTLSGGSPGGGSYFGNGVSAGVLNPSGISNSSSSIFYVVTNGNACKDTASQNISIKAPPTVSLNAFSGRCINSADLTLSGGSPSNGTYYGNNVSNGVFSAKNAGVGSHSVHYRYTGSNGCSDTATKSIQVNALPSVNLSALSNKCLNDASFALTNGSPSGGSYSGTGISSGSFNPSIAGTGTHSVIYSYTDNNGCSNADTSSISVKGLPNVSLTVGAVCSNTPNFTLNGGLPSGGTYSGTGVSSGSFSASTAGAGTHVINYSYTDTNSCTNHDTASMLVHQKPAVTLSSFASVCSNGSSIILTGGSPTGGSYSGTAVSSGSFNPKTAGVGSHSIQYTFTDAKQCKDSLTKNIVVAAAPTVTHSSLNNICANASSITLSGGSPSGGTYKGKGVSSGVFDPSVAGAGSHIISYSVTNSSNCSDSIAKNHSGVGSTNSVT